MTALHETGGVLVQDAAGTPVRVPLDAARGRVRAPGQACPCDGRAAQPARVVVMGPERHRAARRRLLQQRGRGSPAERVERPAMPQQPAAVVTLLPQAAVRLGDGRDGCHQVQAREVRLAGCQGGHDQVQVTVGQRGRHDQAGPQAPASRARTRQPLHVAAVPAATTRPPDTASASTQPKPAGPARVAMRPLTMRSTAWPAAQARPPPASSAARATRSRPAPRPRASATRALGPLSVPASMAPAACHETPPPGKP